MLKIILSFLLIEAGVFADVTNPCPGPGIFPHPYSTTNFLICSGNEGSATLTANVPCPEDYTFSLSEKTCVSNDNDTRLRVSRATTTPVCTAPGPVCASCDLLVVCMNKDNKMVPLQNISCSDTSPENVCDPKTKGCKPPDTDSKCTASSKLSTFRCLQPGFFPDPVDCKKYHICDETLTQYEDSCDGLYEAEKIACFDNTTCTNTVTDPPCSSIANLLPKAIPTFPRFYSFCIPNVMSSAGQTKTVMQTSVLECPLNREFDNTKFSCEMVCKTRPSRMADPTDCHVYYECPKTPDPKEPIKKMCPENLAFDSFKSICAPEQRVQSCFPPHIITTREVNETEAQPTPSSLNTTNETHANTTITTPSPPTVTNKTTTITNGTTATVTNGTTAYNTTITSTTKVPSTTTSAPNRCREGEVTSDRSNCRSFLYCSGGQLVRRYCPLFRVFNSRTNTCDFRLFNFFNFC